MDAGVVGGAAILSPSLQDGFCVPVPPDHDTVWGYLVKFEPHILELMVDPVRGPLQDEKRALRLAEKYGYDVIETKAPPRLLEAGLEKVSIFPMSVLVGVFPTNP